MSDPPKGKRSYELRLEGHTWSEVGLAIYPEKSSWEAAGHCITGARSYARRRDLLWPLPIPPAKPGPKPKTKAALTPTTTPEDGIAFECVLHPDNLCKKCREPLKPDRHKKLACRICEPRRF